MFQLPRLWPFASAAPGGTHRCGSAILNPLLPFQPGQREPGAHPPPGSIRFYEDQHVGLPGSSVRPLDPAPTLLCPRMLPGICFLPHRAQFCRILSGGGFVARPRKPRTHRKNVLKITRREKVAPSTHSAALGQPASRKFNQFRPGHSCLPLRSSASYSKAAVAKCPLS